MQANSMWNFQQWGKWSVCSEPRSWKTGLLSAKCAEATGYSYLAVSVGEGAGSHAVKPALMRVQAKRPDWGSHALDVNLALGNLVELVRAQAKQWIAASSN